MSITIRKAERKDLKAVHDLVRALAVYEKAEAEFVASLNDYEENWTQGVFESIVAEVNGEIVGMTLYYLSYSTWKGRMLYLEDFVVLETHRRLGIGQLLFDATLEVAKSKGCKLMKWQVLDWNEPALDFYLKNEAIIEKEWWNGKIFIA
ncbi:MAG: GNAT family N-acetyltransferase [Bacteroidota bacterium]